jgi:hypothetical protein
MNGKPSILIMVLLISDVEDVEQEEVNLKLKYNKIIPYIFILDEKN